MGPREARSPGRRRSPGRLSCWASVLSLLGGYVSRNHFYPNTESETISTVSVRYSRCLVQCLVFNPHWWSTERRTKRQSRLVGEKACRRVGLLERREEAHVDVRNRMLKLEERCGGEKMQRKCRESAEKMRWQLSMLSKTPAKRVGVELE